jgi:DNA-binding Lrp family transcriptional regulator
MGDENVHGRMLDEDDLALVHTLQIAPRISWAAAARVLGSAPATLVSRWQRLREEGLAWVTVHTGENTQHTVGFIDVDCEPGTRHAVSRTLCADPRVVSVDESAAGRDLLLTVIVRHLGELTRFVLDDLTSLPGVRRQHTAVATALHRQGSRWRLDALNASQQAALEPSARPSSSQSTPPVNAWPLIEALTYDGRRSAAEIAELTCRNPATVRRQLSRLIASDVLAFRCEVAQSYAGWPINCSWFSRVPPAEQDRTVRALNTLPGLRLCASTTGETNLTFSLSARSLSDLLTFERLLGKRLPWIELRESVPHLRTVKRMGWILDEDGRATGQVVVPSAFQPYC